MPTTRATTRAVLAVIALGGMIGASTRFALERAWPQADGGLPWTTLGVNTSGCLLIGVLMVHVVEVGGAHPLLRPLVGVGVLGGYTTFSTYAVQVRTFLDDGRTGLALGYLLGTAVSALAGVGLGVYAGRTTVRVRHRLARGPGREET